MGVFVGARLGMQLLLISHLPTVLPRLSLTGLAVRQVMADTNFSPLDLVLSRLVPKNKTSPATRIGSRSKLKWCSVTAPEIE